MVDRHPLDNGAAMRILVECCIKCGRAPLSDKDRERCPACRHRHELRSTLDAPSDINRMIEHAGGGKPIFARVVWGWSPR